MASTEHEVTYFEQCTLFNSSHRYHDGFDRAVCKCGWKSAASKDQKALVGLFGIHKRDFVEENANVATEDDSTLETQP